MTAVDGHTSTRGEVAVKNLKTRLAASSGLVTLVTVLSIVGAPWKWC